VRSMRWIASSTEIIGGDRSAKTFPPPWGKVAEP
jgi:hypothetical protein